MKTFRRLTNEGPAQIEILHKEGYGVKQIEQRLRRAASTLSTELRRLVSCGCYSAAQAQKDAAAKAGKARRTLTNLFRLTFGLSS